MLTFKYNDNHHKNQKHLGGNTMAQINITLNQEEILQLMHNDREGAFKKLLQESLNSVLKAESAEQLGALPYQRTEERTDSRNGSRDRTLNTRIGSIILSVPRHRYQPFKTMIFENYSRSEAALISTMTEMVVNGVSTRKVSRVVETLCGTSFSKSTVSDLCRDLDYAVNEFRNRPLEREYPFVIVDATYFRVRENNRVISKALMVAFAFNENGRPEIIGFGVYDKESKDTWRHFLNYLKGRGLKGVKMLISDAHEGIIHAASHIFPEVPWQRCQYHFTKNILDKVPKKYQKGFQTELQDMFNSTDLKEARKKRDEIMNDYQDIAGAAMECLDNGFESAMTVMYLPKTMRRSLRTSNRIERLNRELKRRSSAIGVFPNGASVLRLMGAVLLELHEKMQTVPRATITISSIRELQSDTETLNNLKKIAAEQQQLLAA